jgi:hypothetical protein
MARLPEGPQGRRQRGQQQRGRRPARVHDAALARAPGGVPRVQPRRRPPAVWRRGGRAGAHTGGGQGPGWDGGRGPQLGQAERASKPCNAPHAPACASRPPAFPSPPRRPQVQWQLATGKRSYLPRLGGPLVGVHPCAADPSRYCVAQVGGRAAAQRGRGAPGPRGARRGGRARKRHGPAQPTHAPPPPGLPPCPSPTPPHPRPTTPCASSTWRRCAWRRRSTACGRRRPRPPATRPAPPRRSRRAVGCSPCRAPTRCCSSLTPPGSATRRGCRSRRATRCRSWWRRARRRCGRWSRRSWRSRLGRAPLSPSTPRRARAVGGAGRGRAREAWEGSRRAGEYRALWRGKQRAQPLPRAPPSP